MNILLTGGLGVNGAWVTRKLVERGYRPVVLENRIDTSLVGDGIAGKIDLVEADITDLDALLRIFEQYKIQRVVHMAALITGIQTELLKGFEVNATGTVKVLEAASKAGVERVRLHQFARRLRTYRRTQRASDVRADHRGSSAATVPRL